MDFKENEIVKILYTNWRGEIGIRTIVPKKIRFASTEWHPKENWLLDAYDLDREAERSYSMKDIKAWWSESNKKK